MALQTTSAAEIDEIFIRSAALVKAWGKLRLLSGRTLEEALTIGGVSYWEVVSPTLAVGALPDAIGQLDKIPLITNAALFRRSCVDKIFRKGLPLLSKPGVCRKLPRTPSILFLGFSRYMFRETLEAVAGSLARKKEFSPVLLTDSRSIKASACREDGFFENSVWEHWNAGTAASSGAFLRELKQALPRAVRDDLFEKIFSGEEAALEPSLKNSLLWLFEVYLPRLTLYSALAKHILAEHRPELIVSPDVNDPRTRLFTLLARDLKIQSLDVQLGFYLKKDIEWRFFLADRLAVTGEANKRVMEFHGVPPEKITITGSARYDKLSSSVPGGKEQLLRELGIPEGKFTILFASQPYVYGASSHSPEARVRMIKDLFELAGGFKQCHLLVKPHPIEKGDELKELAAGYENITMADRTRDIRGLIAMSDAFITFCSNSTFDALAIRKPTIALSSVCSFFEESGAVLVARSREDLRTHLEAVILGLRPGLKEKLESCRARLVEEWLYKIDGRSAERIEALALSMIRR